MQLRHLLPALAFACSLAAAVSAQEGKFVPAPPELKKLVATLPQPQYPPALARGARPEGTVVLRMYVAENGQVAQTKVAKSSGNADLDKAALNAVKGFKFTPYAVNGKNIAWFFDYSAKYKAPAAAGQQQQQGNAPKRERPDY
ncbi:MAG: energy transducer TonB [Verrucomicrobia bacterium]|nr:energy transducer TonB [Verrucomicrobiota bacterium]